MGGLVTTSARGAGWLLLLTITVLSLVPPTLRPETGVPHDLEHFAIFAAAGLAFGIGYSRRPLGAAMGLVLGTRAGGGKKPESQRQEDVTILDRFQNAAMVKIVANDWVDYLQVAKFNGQWKIINVLWEMKSRPAEPSK